MFTASRVATVQLSSYLRRMATRVSFPLSADHSLPSTPTVTTFSSARAILCHATSPSMWFPLTRTTSSLSLHQRKMSQATKQVPASMPSCAKEKDAYACSTRTGATTTTTSPRNQNNERTLRSQHAYLSSTDSSPRCLARLARSSILLLDSTRTKRMRRGCSRRRRGGRRMDTIPLLTSG